MIKHSKEVLLEKENLKNRNIKLSCNQNTNQNKFIKHHYSHTWLYRTYKPYLETLLCVNFLFDPRIENGTIKKQQLESKVACYQHENFRSNLDSSVSYDCHALLINTCICMQSACLGATIVSLLFNKSSLIPTLQRITSNSISWMSKLFSTDNFADCYS